MCENKRKLRNLFNRVRMHMSEVSKAHVRLNELEVKEVSSASSYAYVSLRVRKPLSECKVFVAAEVCDTGKTHVEGRNCVCDGQKTF